MSGGARMGRVVVALLLAALLAPPAYSDDPPPDLDQPYLRFDVLKQAELHRLLSETLPAGYRILDFRGGFRTGWTTGGYALLLEKRPPGTDALEYEVVVRREPDRLEEALNEAAIRGFRLAADGLFHQIRGVSPFQDSEFVALMEKSAETGRHYLVLSGEKLLPAIEMAASRGYDVLGIAGSQEITVVVLEKSFHAASPETVEYRLLSSGGLRSMRKQLGKAAEDGYRLTAAARPGGDYLLLVRKGGETTATDYFLPSPKKLLEEIHAAAARGYRLLPDTVDSVPVMEKATAPREYRIIEDEDLSAWNRKLSAAREAGFRVLRLFSEFGAILERRADVEED